MVRAIDDLGSYETHAASDCDFINVAMVAVGVSASVGGSRRREHLVRAASSQVSGNGNPFRAGPVRVFCLDE